MRIPRVRYSVLGLMIVAAVVGAARGGHRMYRDHLRSLEREAASRAIARKQLVLIDEAWEVLEFNAQHIRIDIINGGTIGPWGRRRLEALRKAGTGRPRSSRRWRNTSKTWRGFRRSSRSEITRGRLQSLHPKGLKSDSCVWRPRSG